jgi:TatD DNase family protein
VRIAESHEKLYATVGCHPIKGNECKTGAYLDGLLRLVLDNPKKVVAIGECGLDWDRLQFCSRDVQLAGFERQLELPKLTKLPLFLHCRNAYKDFVEIIKRHHNQLFGGLVHSFTGSAAEAKIFTDMGYYISINGCGLRTRENIEAMCSIPTEFLMIETGLF